MSNKAGSSSGGIGFIGLLTIVFIVLKLTETIYWSWIWVLSPIWISIALIVVIGGAALGLYVFFSKKKKKRAEKAYLKMKAGRKLK